jgi:hypothetical protein
MFCPGIGQPTHAKLLNTAKTLKFRRINQIEEELVILLDADQTVNRVAENFASLDLNSTHGNTAIRVAMMIAPVVSCREGYISFKKALLNKACVRRLPLLINGLMNLRNHESHESGLSMAL